MTDFTKIKGGHTVSDDLAATNPNYATGLDDYTQNCGNCITAYELRRRGFDVEAAPRVLMSPDEWATMFEGFEPKTIVGVGTQELTWEQVVGQDIASWGEGARGTIYGAWKDTRYGAHFFSVEVINGKAVFLDAQKTGANAGMYLMGMISSTVKYGRLDNLKPSENVKQAVINRRVTK